MGQLSPGLVSIMAWLAAEGFQNSRCLTPSRLTSAAFFVHLTLTVRQPCSFTPSIHPMPKKSRYQMETRATTLSSWYILTDPRGTIGRTTGYLCSRSGRVDPDAEKAVPGTTSSSPLRDTSGPTTCQRLTAARLIKLERSTPDMKCNSDAEDKNQAMTLMIHVTVQDFRPLIVFYPTLVLSHNSHQVTGALPSRVSSSSPRNRRKKCGIEKPFERKITEAPADHSAYVEP